MATVRDLSTSEVAFKSAINITLKKVFPKWNACTKNRRIAQKYGL